MKRILSLILMLSIALALPIIGCTPIKSKIEVSECYDLQSVYNEGKLTKQDILNMAYYKGDSYLNEKSMQGRFVVKEKKNLTKGEEEAIKYAIATSIKGYLETDESYLGEKIHRYEYLGEYNGYHAVVYDEKGYTYETQAFRKYIQDYYVGGVRLTSEFYLTKIKLFRIIGEEEPKKVQEEHIKIKVEADAFQDEVTIEKGEVFSVNDVCGIHSDFIEGIYLDREYTKEYNYYPITEGTTLYLKLKKTEDLMITKDELEQIRMACEKDISGGRFDYYLGEYKGYKIVEFSNYFYDEEFYLSMDFNEKVFSGLKMTWSKNSYIVAWKDGKSIEIEELYEKGELDLQDWTAIVEGHYQMHPEMKK